MSTTPVPLAPSVIKSLANKLARSPLLASQSLSRAQSIEAMSRILGHDSWYAAQQQTLAKPPVSSSNIVTVDLDAPHLQPAVLLADPRVRRRLYDDLLAMLDAAVDITSAAGALKRAGRVAGDAKLFALGHHMVASLMAGHVVGEFFICLRTYAPMEALAIQFSEKSVGLIHGFQEARRVCP